MIVIPTITSSPTAGPASVDVEKHPGTQPAGSQFWVIAGPGVLILFFLIYILYREWKKTAVTADNNQK